jgi:hypothetical protein
MGTDKVLGLYKSKNRRREYDQNEVLHKAMNYMYILSEGNQDYMADHILKMVQFIQMYLSTCRTFKQDPTTEDITELTQKYVENGSAEAENFLNELRDQFYRKMLSEQDANPPLDFLENLMHDEMLGLKIKHRAD